MQYEDPEDAKAALDNMNESELYGRVLKVNIAQPQAVNKNRAGTCVIASSREANRIESWLTLDSMCVAVAVVVCPCSLGGG